MAFQAVKTALSSAPVLARFYSSLPIVVETDAFGVGIAGNSSQNDKLVMCASRTLSPAEQKYSVSEIKCFAVVFSCQKFRHFLEFIHFIVKTDHQAHTQLLKCSGPNAHLIRWSLFLSFFDRKIIYRTSAQHQNADSLSRHPVDPAEPYGTDALPFFVNALTASKKINFDEPFLVVI